MDLKKLAVLFLLLASVAAAQTEAPTLPADVHSRVRDMQLEQSQLQVRALQIQSELTQIQARYNNLDTEISGALAKANADAKVDPGKWTIDKNTLKYTAVPPKPEEKKESPKKP